LTIAVFIVAVALIAPELATSRLEKNLLNLWLVYSISAIGFQWIFGVAGRFAFCHTFMMALGAYTSAWVTRADDGRPFWMGVVAAILATAFAAGVIGALLARSGDFYFGIATLAVTQVGLVVFTKNEGFTGPNGTVIGVSPITIFGREFRTDEDVFWVFLGALALTLLLAAWLERSPLHRHAIASRDRAMVAHTVGIRVGLVKWTMFVLGSAVAGVAGALVAHWSSYVGTNSFGVNLAIGIFLMVVLGGLRSFWGPVIGGAFYVAVPEVLSSFERYEGIIYGAVLLLVIIVLPDGIIGLKSKIVGIARGAWRRRVPAASITGDPQLPSGADRA
jgi:branched-chain amino acid transport system permease protein